MNNIQTYRVIIVLILKSLFTLRILPRNRCFYAEFVYPIEDIKSQLDASNVLGIDHGIDNWLTCVRNVGTSFIIDGKHLKSLNQWYNKRVATLKENQPQGFWSKQLAGITEKRNRQMRDAVNKALTTPLRVRLWTLKNPPTFCLNERSKI